jgi:excisionase family DNA binding protein
MPSGRHRAEPLHRTGGWTRSRGTEEPSPPLSLERARLRDASYVAALLGIPRKTVLQYARDGRLPSVRLGKHVRFVVADVERAIDRQRQPG